MSGYSSKLRYDENAYVEEVERSVNSGHYRLEPLYNYNKDVCIPKHSVIGTRNASYNPAMSVEVDSILSNRTKVLTKSAKYGQPTDLNNIPLISPPDCNDFLYSEPTRFSHPAYEIKGTSPDRFFKTIHDSQCHIFYNFETNTRREARDKDVQKFQLPIENNKDLKPTKSLGNPKK